MENGSGLSSAGLPVMERQGSRMQVDEDSRNARYQTDTFRMLGYKVVPCCKRFKHHWNSCPFLHPNERAKRRDPRFYYYESTMCPAVKNSDDKRKLACPQKDQCNFSHNVFEEYLHPDRYRTVMCKDFPRCNRDVCFFAHTQDEIRRVDQAWSWNQLARDNFQSTPLSAFLSATGGLKVSPVASIITKLLYNGRIEEAKRSVADTVGKMFRECWKLDNPEAAVLIEALALQAELPIALQPDVEEAVKYIRQNGPRRQSSSSREGVIGTGFANDNPLPGYGALTLAGQNGRQHANISSLWSQSNMLDQENAFSQASLLASLGLGMNAADAEQLQTHWGNSSQEFSGHSPQLGGGNLQNMRAPLLSLDALQLGKLSSYADNGSFLDHMNGHHQSGSAHQSIQQLLAALDTTPHQGLAGPENGPPLAALQTILNNAGVNGRETAPLGLPGHHDYNLPLDLSHKSVPNQGYMEDPGSSFWMNGSRNAEQNELTGDLQCNIQARPVSGLSHKEDQIALNAAFNQLNIKREC